MYTCMGISTACTNPVLTRVHESTVQKAMCMQVRVRGNGKPPSFGSRMYLLTMMTAALQTIHMAMYLQNQVVSSVLMCTCHATAS